MYFKIIILSAALALTVSVISFGCKTTTYNEVVTVETDIKKQVQEESEPDSIKDETSFSVDESGKKDLGEVSDNEETEKPSVTVDDEDIINALFGFFEEVKQDNEYGYFSSETISISGTTDF